MLQMLLGMQSNTTLMGLGPAGRHNIGGCLVPANLASKYLKMDSVDSFRQLRRLSVDAVPICKSSIV